MPDPTGARKTRLKTSMGHPSSVKVGDNKQVKEMNIMYKITNGILHNKNVEN